MTSYESGDIDLAPRLTSSRDGKMTGPFLVETSRQAGEISRVNPLHETRRPRAHRSKTSFSSTSKVAPRSLSAGTSPNGIDGDLELPSARTSPSMSRGSTTYSNGVATKPLGDVSSKVNAWNFGISTDLTSISSRGQSGWDSNSTSPTEKRPSLQQNKGDSLSTLRERERNQTVGTIGDSGPSFGSLNLNFPTGQAARKQLSPEVSPLQRQRCLTFEPAVSSSGHAPNDRIRPGHLPYGASGNDAEKNVRDIVNSVVDDDEQTDFAGYNGSLPHTRRSSGHQISINDTQNAFSAISTRPSSLYTSSSRTESASSVTTMSPSHSRFSGANIDTLDSPNTNGNRSNMFRSEAQYDGLFSSLSKLSLGDRGHSNDCDSLESTYYREPVYRERSSWQALTPSQSGLPNISSRRTSSSHTMLGLRSPQLEEFRHDRVKKWELRDIFGHVTEFSGDQHGSRFIQQKMEVATSDERQRVFEEILPNARQLMQDVFGNYVCQKFFEHGHQIQKQILAKQIEGHVLNLSLGMYGCRVVQKALEHVLVQQQIALISELDGHVLRCVRDQNANHVIQRAIERCPPDSVEFIVRTFHGQVYALSGHPYGCRVLQRIFEHSPESQTRRLLEELHQHVENLVIDQYGNYVIQHVIANGQEADRRAIFSKLYGQIVVLSKHKFASNVIEKCIMYGTPETQYRFVTEFVSPTSEGSSPLFGLINDRFGNYVVQKMLDEGRGEARQLLVEAIRPQLPDLRRYGFGRHLSAIERSVMETPSYGEIWSHMNNESTWARGHNVYG